MAGTDIRSIYSTFLEILGLLGGTLSGLFLLGIFSRRATGSGAIVGVVLSAAVVFGIRFNRPLNVYAYAPIGVVTCMVAGWFASLLLPAPGRDLSGLMLPLASNRSADSP